MPLYITAIHVNNITTFQTYTHINLRDIAIQKDVYSAMLNLNIILWSLCIKFVCRNLSNS